MTRIFFGIIILLCAVVAVEAQDSLNMSCVSRLDYWQDIDDIQIVGNLAYVVCSGSGLHIVDMSNAVNPVEIGKYILRRGNYSCGGVYVTGNRAYLALGTGLIVLDVSEPTNPIALNEPFDCCMIDILVHDQMGIGTNGDEGYPFMVDLSDLDNIHYVNVASPSFHGPTQLIGLAGEYFCMTQYTENGIRFGIFGLDSARQLQLVSEIVSPTLGSRGMISGNFAYLASWQEDNGVSIIDVSDPLLPFIAGTCDCGSCADVSVVEGHAAIALGGNVMEIWNVNSPTQTFFEGSYTTERSFYSVYLSGFVACLGGVNSSKAVEVVDVSQPSAPMLISTFGNIGFPSKITTDGTVAYVADSRSGLRTVDLSDPTNLSELGRSQGYYMGASDVAVQDNKAYLASHHGIPVYDISNPDQLDSLLSFGVMSEHTSVVLNGDYLYTFRHNESVVCGYLLTYDLHDPVLPVCVDSSWIEEYPMELVRSNDLLFCMFWHTGFCIYSLTNPASPQRVGTYSMSWGSQVTDLEVEGRYAYVGINNEAIQVINLSDPANPTQIGRIQEEAYLIAVRGDTMVLSTSEGLKVLDISDYDNPITLGFYTTHDAIENLKIYGSNILTISLSQFGVYQCDALSAVHPVSQIEPVSFALHSCYPNPFNPTTQISFDLPKSDHVSLKVFDILGREIATLVNGKMTSGAHTVRFDGTDLPTGIYLYRLQSGAFNKTSKMILLK